MFELSAARWEALRAAYATPPRAYHSFEHVRELEAHWRDVEARLGWQRPLETWAAVLYHDAIYVAGRADNEAESARLARRELAGTPELDLDEVERLILLTAEHGKLTPAGVDRDTALFLDCDMAILGSPPERYARYERAIREEYAAIPDALLAAGRRRFIERLLAAERIFLSDDFHARLDAQARENLRSAR